MEYLKYVVIILILSLAWITKANAHGGPVSITPHCIVGFPDDGLVKRCNSSFSENKLRLSDAYEAYKRRNIESFQKMEEVCKSHLQKAYIVYAIKPEEKRLLKKGAEEYIKLTWDEIANSSDFYTRCEDHIDYYNSGKLDITPQQIEGFKKLPPKVLFMQVIDKDYRLKPPVWVEANFQRDRNWDYADMAWSIRGFKIEKRKEKSSICLNKPVDQCIEKYDRAPDERRILGQDREEIVYYGVKLLFEGTVNENFSKGPEKEILIVRKGLVVEYVKHYQVIEYTNEMVEQFGLQESQEYESYGKKKYYFSPRHHISVSGKNR